MKRFIAMLVGLGLSAVSITAYSGLSLLPSWAKGDMKCEIDGRPAKMNWKVVDDSQMTCDPSGEFCTSTNAVKTIGKFSDNGGAWVPLSLRAGTSTKVMAINYLGLERNNWQLTYEPNTKLASGWTSFRGSKQPLECWKGINASKGTLFQRHADGKILTWDGKSSCTTNTCLGWTLIDRNVRTNNIVAAGKVLYQRHVDGKIWKWDGRLPCTVKACPGWTEIDHNTRTRDIIVAKGTLFVMG